MEGKNKERKNWKKGFKEGRMEPTKNEKKKEDMRREGKRVYSFFPVTVESDYQLKQ